MPEGTRREESLSRVEKQLVLLAIERKRNIDQHVARMQQEVQQVAQQGAEQFTLDTRPIQEAHPIAEDTPVLFDVRDDADKTMFLAWTEPKAGVVVGTIAAKEPIDPLT